MSSHYSRNILEADWEAEQSADYAERLERAEREAMGWFRSSTREALEAHTRAIVDLQPYYGSPKWARARDAADRAYSAATKPVWALYQPSVDELMATGEISPELDAKWTALRDAVRQQNVEVAA